MKNRVIAAMVMVLALSACAGCGSVAGAAASVNAQISESTEQAKDAGSTDKADEDSTGKDTAETAETTDTDDSAKTVKTVDADDAAKTSADDAAKEDSTGKDEGEAKSGEKQSVQEEIELVEAKSQEFKNADWENMSQTQMNQTTGEWYQLWDDELNSLWNRLKDEVTADKKDNLLIQQKEWIARKEANVKEAGSLAEGGSLQPQLEYSIAMELTRVRAYQLAAMLAEMRGDGITLSAELEKELAEADPSLDDVFAKYQGKWFFDSDRGACIGVEKTAECEYGKEGSSWTVWITGGDLLSDLDVVSYTTDTITFHGGGSTLYYKLRRNMEGSVELAYGESPDSMDEAIITE